MLHITYAVQNGCHCCKHVFVKREYEESNSYYCTLRARKRPKCGSCLMGEGFSCHAGTYGDKEHYRRGGIAIKAWDKWAEGKEVLPWAICNQFKLTEGEKEWHQ